MADFRTEAGYSRDEPGVPQCRKIRAQKAKTTTDENPRPQEDARGTRGQLEELPTAKARTTGTTK